MKTKKEISALAIVGVYNEFVSPNGITMIEGISMNWQKQYKYHDNTGPWSLFITVDSMTNMKGFMWKANENNELSIFGEEDEDRISFNCNTLEEAEFFVQRYLEGNKLELAPLYRK